MPYPKSVIWSDDGRDSLKRLDTTLQARAVRAIQRYAQAGTGDVKRLEEYRTFFRLRFADDWRVIFAESPQDATILYVGNRDDVYKVVRRLSRHWT